MVTKSKDSRGGSRTARTGSVGAGLKPALIALSSVIWLGGRAHEHSTRGDENVSMFKSLLRCLVFLFLVFPACLLACPQDCDEKYFPVFQQWAPRNVWGDGASISGPLDPQAVEKKALEKVPSYSSDVPKLAFGYLNKAWTRLVQNMQAGDTLHFYSMDDQAKRSLSAEEGYAVIRDGKIVAKIATIKW
jgi:hypothetical protein